MKTIAYMNLLLIFLNIGLIFSSKCGADKLKVKLKPVKDTKKIKRMKISESNANSLTPLKIGFDFTTLKKPSSMSSSVFNTVTSLLKDTRDEFSKLLKVSHQNYDLDDYIQDIIEVCEVYTIGKDYRNFLVKNDLIIFPQFVNEYYLGEGVLAAAAPCIIDYSNLRPIGGILYINSDLNFGIKNTEAYVKQLLIHEMTHILVFHPYFFEYLGLSETKNSMSYITSDKVLAQAKKHYGCDNFPFPGVPLEDQGGEGSVGSHWESRYMLGDYMVSTDFPDSAISDITLALFEDSGFYKVNYYSGGLFKFGKNEGCEFLTEDCIVNKKARFDEFCDVEDEPKCSISRTIKSSCYLVNYQSSIPYKYRYFGNSTYGGFWAANYCPIPLDYTSGAYEYDFFPNHCLYGTSSGAYGETIGENSYCFMSSLSLTDTSSSPVCYQVECDSTNQQIKVTVGSGTVTCPTEGGMLTLSPLKGSIECPKYSDVCNTNDNIVCNDMFNCIDKYAENDESVTCYDYSGDTFDVEEYYYDNYDYFDYYDYYLESFNIKLNSFLLILFGFILVFN